MKTVVPVAKELQSLEVDKDSAHICMHICIFKLVPRGLGLMCRIN